MRASKIVFIGFAIFLFSIMAIYKPSWNVPKGRSVINWDVSGYYFYLPAIFIYQDLKKVKWHREILSKYKPTPGLQQGDYHKNGNFVMKYSCGQAIAYLPFFTVGHIAALVSDKHAVDGFSNPYQWSIFYGSLIIALLSLYFARGNLRHYFEEWTVTISLIILVLATNWLNYATLSGAMTHNYLFLLYSLLILTTIKFYEKASYKKALVIGLLVGFMALIRPTEILSLLIPLLWPLKARDLGRLHFFKSHYRKILLAVIACGLVGSIQLVYWKYITGKWLYYTYSDQGFNFIRPYVREFLWSYQTGWLLYTPVMLLTLVGFYFLWKNFKKLFAVCFIFFFIFVYIAFSWDVWNYGGSLSQRTMVQCYPILLFPLCSFIQWLRKSHWTLKLLFTAIIGFCCMFNLWCSHQASKGSIFVAGHMSKSYLKKTLFTFKVDKLNYRLLDNPDEYTKEIKDSEVIYFNDFQTDNTVERRMMIHGSNSMYIKGKEVKVVLKRDLKVQNKKWLRAKARIQIDRPLHSFTHPSYFRIRLYLDGEEKLMRYIKTSRLLQDTEIHDIFYDIKTDGVSYDRIEIEFQNSADNEEMWVDDVLIEVFDE